MSLEDFQILHNEPFDNSVIKEILQKYTISKEHN